MFRAEPLRFTEDLLDGPTDLYQQGPIHVGSTGPSRGPPHRGPTAEVHPDLRRVVPSDTHTACSATGRSAKYREVRGTVMGVESGGPEGTRPLQ